MLQVSSFMMSPLQSRSMYCVQLMVCFAGFHASWQRQGLPVYLQDSCRLKFRQFVYLQEQLLLMLLGNDSDAFSSCYYCITSKPITTPAVCMLLSWQLSCYVLLLLLPPQLGHIITNHHV
jgi:hypothetical protein